MPASKRIHVPATGHPADANILPRHPADDAAWIWHPGCQTGRTAFLRFHLDFETTARTTLRAHVSADHRFQFSIDGCDIGHGPDRCDLDAWSVQSYDVELDTGAHRIEALVWWIEDQTLASPPGRLKPPVAQSTWRGGFLFAGEGAFAPLLNTGGADAAWRVIDLTAAVRPVAVAFPVYHDIGPEFHVDGSAWTNPPPSVDTIVTAAKISGNPHGVRRPGWRLLPSALPEQQRARVTGGRLRSSTSAALGWGDFLAGKKSLTLPPRSEHTALWDFEDYICGCARLATKGGAGARVRIDWAEALHEDGAGKGNRDEVAGKHFHGFGDEYQAGGGAIVFPCFWWRSGRYLRVTVTTDGEPLTLQKLEIISTGYPLDEAAAFRSDNPAFDAAFVKAVRTLRVCAHELWVDCPYYEQMAYVGDTRLAALTGYALFSDDRLSRRMIELFDRSRRSDGFVAERAPGGWPQVSVTYSLLWTLMVRDFAWWRDDAAFVRARLPGVRAMLDTVNALCDDDGLLARTPGWPFVDWVPEWNQGCGPGVREGDSSIVNLHWLLALQAAAELEDAFGEPLMAASFCERACRVETAILARYWSAKDSLLRDTRDASAPFSEHAQALGLLAGLTPPGGATAWAGAWLAKKNLARATIYFSHYVLDALRLARRAGAFDKRMQDWLAIVSAPGLLTLPEMPEPTRSDCHCWGAHARWHATATLAGVRPGAPGFAKIVIEPQMGVLAEIHAEVPHPRGAIKISLLRDGARMRAAVVLPAGAPGELRMNGKSVPLREGANEIEF